MVTKNRNIKNLDVEHLLFVFRNKRSILFVKVEERKDIDKTHIVLITKDHSN